MLRTSMLMSAVAALTLSAAPMALAEEAHVGPTTEYVEEAVKPWLSDPVIINAIKAQNEAHANLASGEIDALDKKWRAEVDADSHPMIDEVLAKEASKFLMEKQEASDGAITEIFIMDDKGLNVAQSAITSDYWQGDESKFQKSYGAGADKIFVDDAEKDESTQMLQAQASMTIVDETGKAIGAITVGVNLDKL